MFVVPRALMLAPAKAATSLLPAYLSTKHTGYGYLAPAGARIKRGPSLLLLNHTRS